MDNNEPAAFMEEAEEADQDEEWLSVGERVRLMTKRLNTKKGDENAEATQAPKRTSMSIADKISQMKGHGSAGAPPPQLVEPSGGSHFIEFQRRLAKKGGGIAERITKLQAGAGDGAAAPPGSPPSASDRSGSGTAPRRVTVADGAKGTGGGITAHTQKLGGEEGIVLPGAFEVPPPLRCLRISAYLSALRTQAPRSCRRKVRKPARRAHARSITRRGLRLRIAMSRAPRPPHLDRCFFFRFFFPSVLLRFSRCWRREEASARGADEPHNVDERRRRPITGRRRRHQYRGSSHR